MTIPPPMPPNEPAPYGQPYGVPAPMGLSAPIVAPLPPRKPGILFPYLMLPMAWGALMILSAIVGAIFIFPNMSDFAGMDPKEMNEALMAYFYQPRLLFTLMLISFIPLPLLPILFSLKTPEGFRKRLGLNKPRAGVLTILVLAIGTFGAGVLASWPFEYIGWVSDDIKKLSEAMTTGNQVDFILALLGIGIVGPIAEELVFRGFIQTRLVARHGPMAGILITSAFFAIWHISPAHVIPVFPVGLMMGIAAWKTHSIWPAIAAHILNNTLAVIIGFYVTDERVMWVLAPVAVLGLGVAIFLLVKMKRPPRDEYAVVVPAMAAVPAR